MFDIILANLGSYNFGNMLNQLDQIGFFKYILPFLLIFALVYAILTKIEIFKENRGAGLIVSAALGLLALQLNYVPYFFQVIFPKFGIGLSILLVALILAGAFLPPDKDGKNTTFSWIFFGLGAAIFLIITLLSFGEWNYSGGIWWQQYGAWVIVAIVVIVAMIMVMVSSKKD